LYLHIEGEFDFCLEVAEVYFEEAVDELTKVDEVIFAKIKYRKEPFSDNSWKICVCQ